MSNSLTVAPPSINGWNAEYLDEQYARYKADPASISADLVSFFQGFDLAMASRGGAAQPSATGGDLKDALRFQAGAVGLIAAYRSHGHLCAKLDPFGRERARPAEIMLGFHGLTDADLPRPVSLPGEPHLPQTSLAAVIERLEQTYCGTIGVQVMHITDSIVRRWLLERLESGKPLLALGQADKLAIFDALVRSETFERFLGKRYPGDKRFSLEGGETLIALLDRLLDTASDSGCDEVVIGMPHRGRLNVLNNIMGKTYEQIFTEFEDSFDPDSADGGGDVKYHRGYSSVRTLRSGRRMHLALASNPSHLESVGAVVAGRTRAKQRLRNDTVRRRLVMPLLVHGDAAVIGQGVVAETLNLSQLEGYRVGGTVHAVINNLIGFTTGPEDSRSNHYCTDLAMSIDAPVFHVNGEDPEACVSIAHLAMQFRQQWSRDAFIDMWCFRKYGHNEQDEASFTQPVLAELVRRMPGVVTLYAGQLVRDGVLTEAALTEHRAQLDAVLEKAQQAARNRPHDPTIDAAAKRWQGMGYDYSFKPVETGISKQVLNQLCAALGSVPDGFEVNPKLKKLLADRAALPVSGQLSHADAELLAVGSLLLEGTAVRISGQDSRRGTFSQRHAVLRDYRTGEPYTPLNKMIPLAESPDDAGKPGPDGTPRQAKLCVYDSPLSEFSVMGFDYGYSLADPNMLVMWEAQFGDFVNGAQTMIDQYLASSELKWDRWSGLTLLLPHGYEGAGPEHSSCRVERFLQLCANENMQVVNPSTAAQMFHLLRRQVRRSFRKPLIVLTPKSMLRVPTSHVDQVLSGHFQDVLDDPAFQAGAPIGGSKADRKGVSRVLLCSGKVSHELSDRREACKRTDTAIVRVEQLYPLNVALLKSILSRYPAKAEVIWVQEEPRNAGAFLYMNDALTVLPDPTQSGDKPVMGRLRYIGRPASATPAVGSKSKSKKETEAFLAEAIGKAPLKPEAKPEAKAEAGAPHANGAHPPKAPAAAKH